MFFCNIIEIYKNLVTMDNKLFQLTSKLIFVLFFFTTISAYGILEEDSKQLFNPPKIKEGSVLNVQDCVSLAFKNSPKVKEKKYELDIAKSNIKLAQSRYFPTLSYGAGFIYERNSNSIYYDKRYRDLPNIAVSVNKMIWDFGKTTANIKMEQFYKIVAEYEFMDELCRTLFDIKAKYYNMLKAMALKEIAKENVSLNNEFANISHEDIDKSTAQIYLAEANSKFINYDGDIDIAKLDLSNSMYIDANINYSIKNTETFNNYDKDNKFKPIVFSFSQNNAIDIAYTNSPDLKVLINTKKAMEQSLNFIKKLYMPEINAGVGYGYNNTNFASNNSLQTAINISATTNPMEYKYAVNKAKSQIDIVNNEIELFKKNLYFEVLRAFSNIDCYEKQLSKLHHEITLAKNTLNIAIKKYKDNKLTYTALQDSRKDYINAQERYIICLYNYNMSVIQAEMAMHYHMVDIHHKAEHAMHHHADELIENLNDALDCNKKEKNTKTKKNNRKKK